MDQINNGMSLLKSECESIFSSVKPPKKEEEKKDEKMEDVENKDAPAQPTEDKKEDAPMENTEEKKE